MELLTFCTESTRVPLTENLWDIPHSDVIIVDGSKFKRDFSCAISFKVFVLADPYLFNYLPIHLLQLCYSFIQGILFCRDLIL